MGLFGTSPFEADVEKATSEQNVSEDWTLIMDICDKVGTVPQHAKDCLRSIVKRLNSPDPHIVLQAITLLDACSSNCGKSFHLEIASRDFENDLRKLINHNEPQIVEKTKLLLKKWAENDFKSDPQLNLIPSLFMKLRSEGVDFANLSEPKKPVAVMNKDPNVVTNSQEEEDIAKAIELSLKETKQHTQSTSSPSAKKTSLYPSVSGTMNPTNNSEGRKVRALYDFEAAEDNELTFLAGEIIHILDDSDQNWWKGTNSRGEGLFPSNFVSADLSVEPEQYTKLDQVAKKFVHFAEEIEVKTLKREPEIVEVEIDEKKMDRLLHLLHEADPESDATDPQAIVELEETVTAMGPLIDAALEKVDRRHAQLTQLSSDLVDALNLYHTLMREPASSSYTVPKMNTFPYQGPPPPPQMFKGMHQAPPQPSQFPTGGGAAPLPLPAYNINVGNISLPPQPHYHHVQPAHHPHQGGTPVPDPSSLPYQSQGYPGQTIAAVPGGGGFPPPRPMTSVNQQPQYAPPNGQHIM